jgi:tetratricopeptide (TPR) repeat protein
VKLEINLKAKFLSLPPYILLFLICLFLMAVTLTAFWQVQHHEFINYDDGGYVTQNLYVRAGITVKGIIWAFTNTRATNWHPLTWLSHMLDCDFYGLNPGKHHLTNLLFHTANTLMLFLVLHRMTKTIWANAFIAVLFALHPLHVESVAWLAERKDLLSTFFWILTMGAYLNYSKRPNFNRYVLVLVLFVLGLMSKPMVVTLPFVLLLLDYWPLCRIRWGQLDCEGNLQIGQPMNFDKWRPSFSHLVLEKTPFFALAAASCLLTLFAQQHGGAVRSLALFPIETRIANALISYVGYMGKMLWPSPLAIPYPHPHVFPIWQIVGAALFLTCVSALVVYSGKRHPFLAVGWLWYIGTLVPVIGLVQVGSQAMADRYTYIPLIGLFIIIGRAVPSILNRWRYRKIVLGISAGIIISSLMLMTREQVKHWQNSVTLFNHTLNVTANNFVAYNQLGLALYDQGKFQEAISLFGIALKIKPDYFETHNNLGAALAQQGKTEEALAHFSKALEKKPDSAEVYNNLGIVSMQQGKIREAIESFKKAVQIKPDFPVAHFSLGLSYLSIGDLKSAQDEYEVLKTINPDLANHFKRYLMTGSLKRKVKVK